MNADQIKVVVITIGLGAFIVRWAYKSLQTRRKVEDMPTSRARSAAQGLNEFQGYAWPLFNTVKCAFNNDCVYYVIHLEKYVKRGKSSTWENIYTHVVVSDFFLIDPTGAVQVLPEGADFSIQKRTSAWTSLSKSAQDFMLKNYIPHDVGRGFPPGSGFFGGLFTGRFRLRENYILLGSPLLVIGGFDSTAGGEKNLHNNPPLQSFYDKIKKDVRLKIGTTSNFFDLNKDGVVEAEEIRRGIYYMARALINPKAPPIETIMTPVPLHGLVKKTDHHDLVVIDSHEALYRHQAEWYLYLCFLGGAALIVFGAYLALTPGLIR